KRRAPRARLHPHLAATETDEPHAVVRATCARGVANKTRLGQDAPDEELPVAVPLKGTLCLRLGWVPFGRKDGLEAEQGDRLGFFRRCRTSCLRSPSTSGAQDSETEENGYPDLGLGALHERPLSGVVVRFSGPPQVFSVLRTSRQCSPPT